MKSRYTFWLTLLSALSPLCWPVAVSRVDDPTRLPTTS